jgi:hypothetical protein
LRTRLCVVREEAAAEDGLRAEDIEEVGAGADLGDERGAVAVAQGGDLDGPPGHFGEDMGAGFPVADVGERGGVEGAVVEGVRSDQD